MNLDDVRATWENIGREDPFWAVLSWDGTEHGNWDVGKFFAEGEREVDSFLTQARAVNASPTFGDALDFGCGLGRLARALAGHFDTVTGVDVSAPMVEQADRLVASEHPNCRFVVNTEPRLPFPAASFDFVLTNIVLQHMPPPLAKGYIREFLRVLRPRGIAILQVPSECSWKSTKPLVGTLVNRLPSRAREVIYRRRRARDPRNLPMHSIARTEVLRFVERAGGRVLACIDDGAGGPDWRSFHYIVRAAPAARRRSKLNR
ncbi:MAG: class I SAM-dependent methyltransferase [Actinomycetota bacterium]|nr:class I SAM-dependent methyltransferase [Actinomycetota bacterium]